MHEVGKQNSNVATENRMILYKKKRRYAMWMAQSHYADTCYMPKQQHSKRTSTAHFILLMFGFFINASGFAQKKAKSENSIATSIKLYTAILLSINSTKRLK